MTAIVHRYITVKGERVSLAPRQVEVLRLLCLDMSKPEIADTLGIGEQSVRTHAKEIFTRLRVRTAKDACAIAVENGIMQVDGDRCEALVSLCIRSRRGLDKRRMMLATGMSRTICETTLALCKARGQLVSYRVGNETLWVPPSALELALEAQSENRTKRRRRLANDRYHLAKASGRINEDNRIMDPPDWKIVRRFVQAGTVPPPKTTAANSVFAWGAAA